MELNIPNHILYTRSAARSLTDQQYKEGGEDKLQSGRHCRALATPYQAGPLGLNGAQSYLTAIKKGQGLSQER